MLTAASHKSFRTRVVQADGRGDFDDFLVAALHRAIALMQMQHVAVPVAQNLHFDVLGARNVFFQKNGRIAERASGFALRFVQQMGQVGRLDAPRACRARRRRRPP